MPTIHLLDQALINKIAAGEVIEKPASIVKELVENALDAGATVITVEVSRGGKERIIIKDNGSGMSEEDALLCIKRHATSKLASDQDLFSIMTMGFRGEALASIAAVSKMTLRTKTKEAHVGIEITFEGEHILSKKPVVMNQGTTVIVQDLFYNTPVRSKYLKGDELPPIIDVLQKYALIHPSLHLTLKEDEKVAFDAPAAASLQEKITIILGHELGRELLPLERKQGDLHVAGFLVKPTISRSTKEQMLVFINKRSVHEGTIIHAVLDALHTLLFHGRYPIVVLDITMDPKMLDVNVHPTKREIRLLHPGIVYETVFGAVREALREVALIPDQQPSAWFMEPKQQKKETIGVSRRSYDTEQQQSLIVAEASPTAVPEEKTAIRVLGQVYTTYIVAEDADGLLLIDQHAADERIFFQQFSEQYQGHQIQRQTLLQPEIIELEPKDFALLITKTEALKKYGFEVEPFGTSQILLRTLPLLLGRQLSKDVFWDVVGELKGEGDEQARKEAIIARMACRAAVKAGDTLSEKEMKELVAKLSKLTTPYTCPHGRPTTIRITSQELEKRFKRKP
ncbi:DNA mismatch repair endonuclease MutL [Candidatus Woesearchaeota archaeon]|nr:DNA mismatch repair endonuclease MutL [Candidatus Woesearchaeota archaeon]